MQSDMLCNTCLWMRFEGVCTFKQGPSQYAKALLVNNTSSRIPTVIILAAAELSVGPTDLLLGRIAGHFLMR